MQPKALIAMSGGVDSSVAAAIMLDKGYECTGFTLKLGKTENSCSARDINDAKDVADRLGILHQVLDYSDEFEEQVIRRFIETYEQGATPNPCVVCNRFIKFNLQLLCRHKVDFDFLATGHYARTERDQISGRFILRKALDSQKDQSYVLYGLDQKQLGYACFPLGELTKNRVREIAADKKFINNAKAESQDICFVPDGDYGKFIETHTGKKYPEGDIVDTEGKLLGRHRGIIHYTIGQRRGLGVAANVPLYVAAKSIVANTVTLAPDSGPGLGFGLSLYSKSLTAKDINLIVCECLDKPLRVTVKTRYLQTAQPATAKRGLQDER